jgi:hypothetical protein
MHRRPAAASRQACTARRFGDDVSWIAARHSNSPVWTPTAIDTIEINVAVNTAVLWAPRSWVTPMNPSAPGTRGLGAAERGHELVRGRVALFLLGWHGRRLLRGVP